MRGSFWWHWKRVMIDLNPNHLATVKAILAETRAGVRGPGLRLPRYVDS